MQQEIDKITDEQADVETHYEKNPDWYKETADYRVNGEEAVWARHILVKVDESATREEKDAARKKAEDIIEKLKAGEDFATLVKEYSEDEGSNSRGGDYVFGKDASFYDEFKDAAFSLEPGEFTQTPVETGAGYHIIKVEEKYAKDEPVALNAPRNTMSTEPSLSSTSFT
jgi:parvulin-like peptidyl-prolyl isomerase